MSKEIGVIGDEGFILGFQLAGIRRAVQAEGEDYESKVRAVLDDPQNLGILIVHDQDVARLSDNTRRRLTDSLDPVVIRMGGEGGGDLREKVKRAIGIDVYKD